MWLYFRKVIILPTPEIINENKNLSTYLITYISTYYWNEIVDWNIFLISSMAEETFLIMLILDSLSTKEVAIVLP